MTNLQIASLLSAVNVLQARGRVLSFIDGSKDFVYISKVSRELLIEIEESLGFKGVVMLFPETARFLG